MRVLFIHNFYKYKGGEDRLVEEEQRLLQEKGHQVLIFSRDSAETATYSTMEKLLFFPRTLYSFRVAKDLRRVLEEFCPDVAVVYNIIPLLSPAIYLVLERYCVPIVQSINNFRWLCLNGVFLDRNIICERCKTGNFIPGVVKKCNHNSFFLSFLYAMMTVFLRKYFAPKINIFVVSNEFVRRKYEEAGFNRRKLAVKPLSIGMRSAGKAKKRVKNLEAYALYLGRLSPEKGVFTLLRAMMLCPNVRLIIAGDGPEEAAVTGFIQQNRLQNVEFRGHVSEKEKEDLMERTSFLVFPSECYENFPITILEAYMSGIPVVGSDIGVMAVMIEDGRSGLLFRAGEEGDLARKIQMLWDSPEKRAELAVGARNKIEKEYSPNYNYQKMLEIFNGLVRQHHGE